MKLPRDLQIHACFNCKSVLDDDNFTSCGISIAKPQVFFDYTCPSCSHLGRYFLDIGPPATPFERLKYLISLIETAEKDADPVKGNIRSLLNKITGVKDLLRLGGKDAPREPTKDDGNP